MVVNNVRTCLGMVFDKSVVLTAKYNAYSLMNSAIELILD